MPMQVILLERVDSLGDLGDVVDVKLGYARNYLIPQNKALRATDDNMVFFKEKKKEIEKQNEAKRTDSEKEAKKLEGLSVFVIRHASESGQLYGSVTARDITEAVTEKSGLKVARSMVTLHDAFKTIGLFDVTVALHPEVKVDVKINIARSVDEAKIQEKSGKALIAEVEGSSEVVKAEAETKLEEISEKAKEKMLEEDALEAEKQKTEEDAEKSAATSEKSAKKSSERAAKKEAAAVSAAAASAEAEDAAEGTEAKDSVEAANDAESSEEGTEEKSEAPEEKTES